MDVTGPNFTTKNTEWVVSSAESSPKFTLSIRKKGNQADHEIGRGLKLVWFPLYSCAPAPSTCRLYHLSRSLPTSFIRSVAAATCTSMSEIAFAARLKLARLPPRSLLPSQFYLLSRKSHFLDSCVPGFLIKSSVPICVNPWLKISEHPCNPWHP